MARKKPKAIKHPDPACPHCGGWHEEENGCPLIGLAEWIKELRQLNPRSQMYKASREGIDEALEQLVQAHLCHPDVPTNWDCIKLTAYKLRGVISCRYVERALRRRGWDRARWKLVGKKAT